MQKAFTDRKWITHSVCVCSHGQEVVSLNCNKKVSGQMLGTLSNTADSEI